MDLYIKVGFVIFVIANILNLILFFKVWGMTNDVRHFLKFYIDDKGITLTEVENYENSGVSLKQYKNKEGKIIDS